MTCSTRTKMAPYRPRCVNEGKGRLLANYSRLCIAPTSHTEWPGPSFKFPFSKKTTSAHFQGCYIGLHQQQRGYFVSVLRLFFWSFCSCPLCCHSLFPLGTRTEERRKVSFSFFPSSFALFFWEEREFESEIPSPTRSRAFNLISLMNRDTICRSCTRP